jgi:hypothetical protein
MQFLFMKSSKKQKKDRENGKLTPEPKLYSSQALPGMIVE